MQVLCALADAVSLFSRCSAKLKLQFSARALAWAISPRFRVLQAFLAPFVIYSSCSDRSVFLRLFRSHSHKDSLGNHTLITENQHLRS